VDIPIKASQLFGYLFEKWRAFVFKILEIWKLIQPIVGYCPTDLYRIPALHPPIRDNSSQVMATLDGWAGGYEDGEI